LQIKTSCGSNWNSSVFTQDYFELELSFTGQGTIDNPYLITGRNNWLNEYFELYISKSNSNSIIRNLKLKALYLKQCENINIVDTNIKYVGLQNCTTISIENVTITKQLRLSDVSKIKIEECNIKKLLAFTGDQISISNSKIKKVSRKSMASFIIYNKEKRTLPEYSSENIQKKRSLDFRFCYQCGTEADSDSIFCYECGCRLNKYE